MDKDEAIAALNRNFKEKVRLVGENKAGKYSSVWTFLPGGDGFYLSARSLINSFKVSLHANNHRGYLAYERKYFGKLKEEGWLSAPNKIVCDWALPEPGKDRATIAASIKLPADFMTADTPPCVSQKKAAVFEIEPGCALEIGVFLSRERGAILECQSAFKFDPGSASNFDPFERAGLGVALVSSELAGVAETRRARVA